VGQFYFGVQAGRWVRITPALTITDGEVEDFGVELTLAQVQLQASVEAAGFGVASLWADGRCGRTVLVFGRVDPVDPSGPWLARTVYVQLRVREAVEFERGQCVVRVEGDTVWVARTEQLLPASMLEAEWPEAWRADPGRWRQMLVQQ
jgi:hypothetical protein